MLQIPYLWCALHTRDIIYITYNINTICNMYIIYNVLLHNIYGLNCMHNTFHIYAKYVTYDIEAYIVFLILATALDIS